MASVTAVPLSRTSRQLPNAGCRTCHLLILRRNDSEVLLLREDGGDHLPSAELPGMQRIAPNLLTAVCSQFGLGMVCRFSVSCDVSGPNFCVVAEVTPGAVPQDSRMLWLPVRDITWERIEPVTVRDLLWTALARATAYTAGHRPGEFVRPGCLEEIRAWVSQSLESRGLRLEDSWTQFNMGPDFSLFRFDTNGPPVWFKAAGGSNVREFDIATGLARIRLPHIPEMIAAREDWHAWLTFDGGRRSLDGDADEECWKAAARSLGELQAASVPHVGELAAAGCDDLRFPSLRSRIEPFLQELAVLMEKQAAVPPNRLGSADLKRIGYFLEAACGAAANLGLPDTLGHSDISPGNILADRQGAVFLDWMEAHVGHPFMTFEYLLALARRIAVTRPIAFDAVRREYLACWRPFRPLRHLEQAFDFVPLVALFAFALTVSRGGDLQNTRPEFAGLIRSLGRRMHDVAERLERAHGARKRIRSCSASEQRNTGSASAYAGADFKRKGGEQHGIRQA